MATANCLASAITVRPFNLSDVTLGPGVFARKRELILKFARGYDERRYINVFRANAGLQPIAGVTPLPAGGGKASTEKQTEISGATSPATTCPCWPRPMPAQLRTCSGRIDFAQRSVGEPALRDLLVSGAQALIIRLTS